MAARQIRIRRGSSAEHATFTGALGELTMDTTTKTLRVHDGETPGGTQLAKHSEIPPAGADFVITSQMPSATNNYTWYRKYKSGWVEQGGWVAGVATGETNNTVRFPVQMEDAYYTVAITAENLSERAQAYRQIYAKTTSSINLFNVVGERTAFSWRISGMAA